MAKTYRLGVIGFAHMHINELMGKFKELPNVEWVACADTVPQRPELVRATFSRSWNRDFAQREIGVPKAYDDYREMLDKERFDIVLFCPENSRHGEVAEAIAAHGAHMVTEKPMAATLAEALRMYRAAKDANVQLMVNWPSTWWPAVRRAKELVDGGVIGPLWEVKWRAGSMGPLAPGSTHPGVDGRAVEITDGERASTWWHHTSTGGGALLDYCCYGACLSRWFIGAPAVAAQGIRANLRSQYGTGDDNAIITVRFPNALAILEATWSCVDHGVANGPLLYGTQGTIVIDIYKLGNNKLTMYRGKGTEPETVEAASITSGRETLAKEFVHHLETGEPMHETLQPEFNLQAQAILDAGIRSADSGKLELINDAAWCIG